MSYDTKSYLHFQLTFSYTNYTNGYILELDSGVQNWHHSVPLEQTAAASTIFYIY